jgi:hypothetical protein
MRRVKLALLLLAIGCLLCAPQLHAQKKFTPAQKIDDAALRKADARTGEWLTHGRTYDEQRFSPLKQINAANVKSLGLAWSFDTNTNRGLGASSLQLMPRRANSFGNTIRKCRIVTARALVVMWSIAAWPFTKAAFTSARLTDA